MFEQAVAENGQDYFLWGLLMDTLMADVKEKTATLRIVLVGCDYITGLGLRQLLNNTGFTDLVGAVDSCAEVLGMIAAGGIDIVMVDAAMDSTELAQTCRALNKIDDPPSVVVLGEVPFDLAESLVSSGVRAILRPGLLVQDLPVALRLIQRGGAVVIDEPAREILIKRRRSFDSHQRANFDSLNEREHIVANGVTEGLTNVQLAASLHMSEATVKLIISSIMTKLGASNRVQVAVVVASARVL